MSGNQKNALKVVKKTNKNDNKIFKNLTFSNRFYIILAIIVVLIPVLISASIIVSNVKKNETFNDKMDISNIDISKNAKNIKEQYQKQGEEDKFITEYNSVQKATGLYIMNNSTLDDNSFKSIITKLETILSSNDWKDLNIQKSNYWSGNWLIDDKGNVSFKFSQKSIEPNWINDSKVQNMITKN